MCANVIVAEDDEKQAELVRRYLEHEGHVVTVVGDGLAALDEVRHKDKEPDLLVLDVMMERADGLDVLRVLRAERRELPVLMLTARSTEDDLLLGLDLGADDYMTKPYSPRELMARVRTLLRRTRRTPDAPTATGATDEVLSVGALRVDPVRYEVSVDGAYVECTPGEFRILAAMAAEPERVFSRQRLLEELHGFDRYISNRTVDVHIMNLRKKIEPAPRKPTRLLTVFGVGYKLTDPAAKRAPRASS
ncbi:MULTISPECIES: response regulator transcription factor [unclassified Streptomyces]|uniref:response regulator transcription factor n=1 Tax=unclassified Streptomyces TaxID=2593676 RepID=UPI002DD8FFAD|nr:MULTISPECIES: response regulator transcription factor [unclassified Streptomyces]WSF82303.1 response regulator transcription factor [Streptomyces sp. NBC_01744]WSC41404.1 response regulator transcription factor [Streptomyces sp. NBC_01763]WSC49791.1 response regulator transcription factor [Streptomyces sp. NBC_01762]WSC51452.1 response regulator transcription factor [Streptomyces sp. NBC_01761]WSD29367.1 response regulator transcription factor [Streptomyces sp. NBC_01751]